TSLLVGGIALLQLAAPVRAANRFRIIYNSVQVDSSYSILTVLATADGGYAASAGAGNGAFLLKLDATGATTFYKTYDLYSMPAIDQLGGGFILAGEQQSYNNPVVMRVDASGNPLWTVNVDYGTADQGFYVVHPTPDGGFLASGIWTAKLDSSGTV